MKLGRRRKNWPALSIPHDLTCTSAAEVMLHPRGDSRDGAILRWAVEVWQRWAPLHEVIVTLCADLEL